MSHPMAFQKASAVLAAKGGGKREQPDVEDAFEDSDEDEIVEDMQAVDEDEDEEDISKDKMIKEKNVKKAGSAASKKAVAPKKGKK